MSDINQIYAQLTKNKGQYGGGIIADEDLELNKELGLFVPNGVMTEEIPLWHGLFSIIRYLYRNNCITRGSVPQIIKIFIETPSSQKASKLNKIYELAEESVEQSSLMAEFLAKRRVEDMIDLIAATLPIEKRYEFFHFILTEEEELPEDLKQALKEEQMPELSSEELALMRESQHLERLEQVFTKYRNRGSLDLDREGPTGVSSRKISLQEAREIADSKPEPEQFEFTNLNKEVNPRFSQPVTPPYQPVNNRQPQQGQPMPPQAQTGFNPQPRPNTPNLNINNGQAPANFQFRQVMQSSPTNMPANTSNQQPTQRQPQIPTKAYKPPIIPGARPAGSRNNDFKSLLGE